jgi:hypothetical protein
MISARNTNIDQLSNFPWSTPQLGNILPAICHFFSVRFLARQRKLIVFLHINYTDTGNKTPDWAVWLNKRNLFRITMSHKMEWQQSIRNGRPYLPACSQLRANLSGLWHLVVSFSSTNLTPLEDQCHGDAKPWRQPVLSQSNEYWEHTLVPGVLEKDSYSDFEY